MYICSVMPLPMGTNIKFKIIYSKEARVFLSTLPEKARRKVLYNIDKVAYGEIDRQGAI